MQVCRFKFHKDIDKETIEEKIALAFITAECTFGPAKVRLNAAYLIAGNKAIIDVSSPVGEHIAEVFTELMIRQFGEESFVVERIRDNCKKNE